MDLFKDNEFGLDKYIWKIMNWDNNVIRQGVGVYIYFYRVIYFI